jgi:hypothetical protein
MSSRGCSRLSLRDRQKERSRKEPHVEIAVFVLSLGFFAVASYFAGVDSRELDLVRQPDIQRRSR